MLDAHCEPSSHGIPYGSVPGAMQVATLHAFEQQSAFCVHVPPMPLHAHVPIGQFPEQHCTPFWHELPMPLHCTQASPSHAPLQQFASMPPQPLLPFDMHVAHMPPSQSFPEQQGTPSPHPMPIPAQPPQCPLEGQ
jgi:hypothetical protein